MKKWLIVFILALTSFCSAATTRYIAQTAGTYVGGTACNGQTAITPATFNATTLASGDIAYICGTITGAAGAAGLITPHNGGSSGNQVKIIGDTGNLLTAPVWGPGTGAFPTDGAIDITHGQTLVTGVNIVATLSGASGTTCPSGACVYDRATAGIIVQAGLIGVSIQNNSITNIYLCNNAAACNTSWYSIGILVSGASTTTDISGNTIDGVGTEIFFEYDGAALSGINIHGNTLGTNHGGYWGIAVGCGTAGCTTSNVNIYANTIYGCTDWNGQYNNGGAGNGYHCDGVIVYSNASAQSFSIYNNFVSFNGALTADVYCTYGSTSPGATCTIFNNVLLVQNSTCSGVGGGRALWLNNGTSGHVIVNNTLVGSNSSCYLIELTSGATLSRIENNIFTAEGYTGQYLATGTTAFGTSDYNDFYTSSGTWNLNGTVQSFAAWQALGLDTHGINTNPILDFNYELQTGSPAIASGVNLTSLGITALNSDKSGAARPSSAAWDMGAYEFSAGTIFTAFQSGDWTDWHTWFNPSTPPAGVGCHNQYPCSTDSGDAGDRIIIPAGITVYCGQTATETCSAGTSPNDQVTFAISLTPATTTGGGITCGNASTIVYMGPVQSTDGYTLTLGPGCKVYHDSSWCVSCSTTLPTTPPPTTGGAAYTWKWGTSTKGGLWAVNGTAASHVTWQGDSMLSPRKNLGSTCVAATSTTIGSCDAGAINFVSGTGCPTNIGFGTLFYIDFKNIAGTTQQSTVVAWCGSTGSTTNLGGMNWNNVTFDNSGTVKLVVATSTDINTIAVSGLSLTHCQSPAEANGCLNFGGTGSVQGAGTYTITGLLTDGRINTTSTQNDGSFVFRNALMWFGGFPPCINANGGGCSTTAFLNTDGGIVDQIFVYHNVWATGTASILGYTYSVSPLNMSNSVYWNPVQVNTTVNPHFETTKWVSTRNFASATANVTNNVFGGIGVNSSVIVGSGTYGVTFGTTPTHTINPVFSGNISLCGYNGYGTVLPPGIFIDGSLGSATACGGSMCVHMTFRNNTTCSTGLTSNGPAPCTPCNVTPGGAGFHTSTTAADTVTSIDSNIWLSFVPGGSWIAEVVSPSNTSTSTMPSNSPNAFAYLGGNYGLNASTFTQEMPPLDFVHTFGVDKSSSATPVFAENNRSPAFFDYEYLTPAGLFNVATYSATAWAIGHAYNVGDVVAYSSSSVYGGKPIYYRCIQAHTASALNDPVLGYDSANTWQGGAPWWELASLQWMRARVMDNTTYDSQCAALLFVTCPAPHTYVTGLLNAWLRAGYVSMDSYVWNACATNGGAMTDCGAVPLTPIQHIAPSMSVN